MKKKYLKIFLLASPFYLKGRSADKLHHLVVARMMEKILKENPKLDSDVMMAVALLHDIGYAKIPKHKIGSFWAKKIKKDHMRLGAELAQDILGRINFPQGKIERVCEIIATHDNPESVNYDNKRTEYLNKLGIRVLRIQNKEVLNNLAGVLEEIKKWL